MDALSTRPLGLANLRPARSHGFMPGDLTMTGIVHIAKRTYNQHLTPSRSSSLNFHNKKDLVSNLALWEAWIYNQRKGICASTSSQWPTWDPLPITSSRCGIQSVTAADPAHDTRFQPITETLSNICFQS